MTLERCSFSKITTTTWSGRGTTTPLLPPFLPPAGGKKAIVSELRGLAGRRVTKLPGAAGIPVAELQGLAGCRVAKLPAIAGVPVADLWDSAGHMVAIPVAEPNWTIGLAADDGSAAVQAESPISSITATAQPIHRGKARPLNSFAAPERSMRTIQRGHIPSAQPPKRRRRLHGVRLTLQSPSGHTANGRFWPPSHVGGAAPGERGDSVTIAAECSASQP